MRKSVIFIILAVVVVILGIIAGMYIYNNNTSNIEPQLERQLAEENKEANEVIQTTSLASEEKISPNSLLILKTYYTYCKHTVTENVDMPEGLVNNTEEELKSKYSNWKVEKFSPSEVIVYMEKEEICSEHYILKENDGYICVYKLDSKGREVLEEETGIVTQYLPEEDLISLKNGIEVNGKENLNAILEDYE